MANESNRQVRLKDPTQKLIIVWQFQSWKALKAAAHTGRGVVPTWSGWAPGPQLRRDEPHAQVTPHRPSLSKNIFMECVHLEKYSSATKGCTSQPYPQHCFITCGTPVGRSAEDSTGQISPSPGSGSWWWQLVQKRKTVTPASSKRVNATKTASDYCPGLTWWKGRTILSWVILSPIYYISPLELF